MKLPRHWAAFCQCALLLPALGLAEVTIDPLAPQQIIDELSLQPADTPMRDYPDWDPQRIVVSLPPWIAQQIPDLKAQFEDSAGEATLVIDTSAAMSPSAEMLAGADAILSLCTQDTMDKASPRLLWLHSYTVGVDGCLGLTPEQIHGRVFTNSKRLMGPGIAEHSIAMLLALAAKLPDYHAAQRERSWDRSPSRTASFGELNGKTMLVVGLGGIGTEVARRADGLGMTVLATRNSSREGPPFVEYVGLSDELLGLAAKSDVIVNALPLTAKTTGIFNEAFFDTVKPGAIFISVGRGASTVQEDLIAALESGQLYGAGLDVTDPEPLPEDSPLWEMDNVIITPHISATGGDSMKRVAVIAVENLRRYVAGEPLLNVVNMQAGY
ncbi:MAG: D-2-hydroxyacid dehydrogenase [Pseudomonadota bacterium]